MALLFNSGRDEAPALKIYLNLDHLTDLPEGSSGYGLRWPEEAQQLRQDGFEGVQLGMAHEPDAGLPYCGLDRINTPEEAGPVFAHHRDRGDQCLTLHVGWGIEDDAACFRLIEAILAAEEKYQLPVFIETHRATITQDIWRTVQWAKKFPEIRFNADFSHYYCGQEMVYGDIEAKWEFMQPIFDRVGFMHGRIASPGCMQAPVEQVDARPRQAVGEPDYLAHFREMWLRAMRGFKKQAGQGDVLIFAPELLTPKLYYARVFPDSSNQLVEESDRYEQALIYQEIARQCFEEA